MTADRLSHLYSAMQQSGLDLLVLNPSPTLTYLTGLQFHLMERPVVAFFKPGMNPVMVLPELEKGKISQAPYPITAFTYGEDPAHWGEVFARAGASLNAKGLKAGVEPLWLRYLELKFLEAALPGTAFSSADPVIIAIRRQKDEAEVASMRLAVDVAQTAFDRMLHSVKVGMTERQLASELSIELLRAGADPEFPFQPIVAGGPNGANPHAVPTDRPFQPGDLVVIDWGAKVHGYIADLTRTIAIKEIKPEMAYIHTVVAAANAAGRAASRPGVSAGDVDQAARAVITDAGYGEYFTHRTGHGVGMELHEEPYIFTGNSLVLAPGMTYTVEPGIYLPGQGGVRVEDNVVITPTGSESLSNLVRDLIVVG
jgi:Xaa-Pro dipeptidase